MDAQTLSILLAGVAIGLSFVALVMAWSARR